MDKAVFEGRNILARKYSGHPLHHHFPVCFIHHTVPEMRISRKFPICIAGYGHTARAMNSGDHLTVFDMDCINIVGHDSEQRFVTFLTFLQGLLRLHPLGDVTTDAYEAQDLPLTILQRHFSGQSPSSLA